MRTDAPALVIGGGPAGLMAAETMLDLGLRVVLVDAKPSLGRKLLMAGKSGLNITRDEDLGRFVSNYAEAAQWLQPCLTDFGPEQVKTWAKGLGQDVFTGSTGRVFPVTMKASPLLRSWLIRLAQKGLKTQTRWRWRGIAGDEFQFDTPSGPVDLKARGCVLALGGASWQRLGSDGAWTRILSQFGVGLSPFQPANVGVTVEWSTHMAPLYGSPLKAAALTAGDRHSRGEVVISQRGLEGGGLYPLGPALRAQLPLQVDLFPDITAEDLCKRLSATNRRESIGNRLRKLGLDGARYALALELARPLPNDPRDFAGRLKRLMVPYKGTRPLDEAISTAGGVQRAAVTPGLMLKALPGVFVAGEMLDWEAPTGGYLLTACLATGRWAGLSLERWSRLQDAGENNPVV